MFKFLRKKKAKGQSTLEFAILIIIVIGALLSIQVYIKRGIQGRLKKASDDIGEQYSPGNTNVHMFTIVNSHTNETFINGVTRSLLLDNETTTDIGNMTILNAEQEFWGSKQDLKQ